MNATLAPHVTPDQIERAYDRANRHDAPAWYLRGWSEDDELTSVSEWSVPSASTTDLHLVRVMVARRAGIVTADCDCEGYWNHGLCWHVVSAAIRNGTIGRLARTLVTGRSA